MQTLARVNQTDRAKKPAGKNIDEAIGAWSMNL